LSNPAAKGKWEAKTMAKRTTPNIISNSKKKPNGGFKSQRSTGKYDHELGKRIRLRRVELHISQSDLADKLGVNFQQVRKYEKGVARVFASRLQQIATALDVPVTFFFESQTRAAKEVDSLLSLDNSFSLRLLRAYASVKNQKVQRQFVSLIEKITANKWFRSLLRAGGQPGLGRGPWLSGLSPEVKTSIDGRYPITGFEFESRLRVAFFSKTRLPLLACAVTRRRFPVGASPTRQPLQPEAIGAVMKVTEWLNTGSPMAWSAMTNRTPARGMSAAWGDGEVRTTPETG
jgi:transcriptional regulator with XRE-family HTH domain